MSTLFNDSPECRALPYYFTALEAAVAFDAFQKRMAKEYPGAWPWPVSISKVATEHNALLQRKRLFEEIEATTLRNAGMTKPPEPQHFDTEAHRTFMRSLG